MNKFSLMFSSYQSVIDLSSITSFHAARRASLCFVKLIAIFVFACYTIIPTVPVIKSPQQ